MQIKFIGVGSAFTTQEYYQSNILITARTGKKILIDCGSDIRFALGECGIHYNNICRPLDAVYISHLHSDHIGGMEWLAFSTYFRPECQKLKLFMEKDMMNDMWQNSLKGGLGCIEGKYMHLTDYFQCFPVPDLGTFEWGGIKFTLVRMPHVIAGYKNHYSYGLLIREKDGPTVFISTDTQFCPDIIKDIGKKADIIFHDCETSILKGLVHAHYDDLSTLPFEIKQKIWLYHYHPFPVQIPEEDDFRGFVAKGQMFEFN